MLVLIKHIAIALNIYTLEPFKKSIHISQVRQKIDQREHLLPTFSLVSATEMSHFVLWLNCKIVIPY